MNDSEAPASEPRERREETEINPEGFIRDAYHRMKQTSRGLPHRGISRLKRRMRGADHTAVEIPGVEEDSGWRPPPGIARSLSGTGKSRRDPQALGSILDRTAMRRDWNIPLSLGTIAASWPEIVGPVVAEHSTVESLEDHRLQIRTDSTAWAKQLQLLLPQIEKRLDEIVGPRMVQQVIVHGPQRPSWKHGPRSVPGRGPRDTYG